jgi:probable phosphoglycerate mutase
MTIASVANLLSLVLLFPRLIFATPDCTSTSAQVKVGHNAVSPNLRLILIRHGESYNNIHHEISRQQYLENRQSDPPLTEIGRKQAHETAQYLASRKHALLHSIDEIHVSPFRRTLETARPLAEALEVEPRVKTDIYEVGGVHVDGVGQGGMTKSEMLKEFPTYKLTEDVTDEGWYSLAKKETREQGRSRVEQVYGRLLQQATEAKEDKTIILVVHGDFIDFLLQTAFGIVSEKAFPCWNTCITVLDIDKTGKPMILMHNTVEHLSVVKTQSLGKC